MCRSDISPKTKKCIKCGEYQNRWRRFFVFFASLTGGLTFIVAGFSYIFQSVPGISAMIFPRPSVEVLSFHDSGSLILVNSGDGNVFVRSVNIATDRDDTKQFGTSSRIVGKTVEAGGTLNHSFKSDDKSKFTGIQRHTIAGESKPVNNEWIDIANHIIMEGKCYELSIMHEEHPFFLTVKSHYARQDATPMTMPHTANIRFYSFLTDLDHTVEFPVVGLVYKIQSEECGQ